MQLLFRKVFSMQIKPEIQSEKKICMTRIAYNLSDNDDEKNYFAR